MGAPTTTDWVGTAKGKGTAVVKILTTPPGSTDKKNVGSLTVIVGGYSPRTPHPNARQSRSQQGTGLTICGY